MDPTCHAEVNAIRAACKKINSLELQGAILYTTCEPCPMCFLAAYLAKIATIVYGLRARDLRPLGWEVDITAEELNRRSGSRMHIIADVLREECLDLFGLTHDHKNEGVNQN